MVVLVVLRPAASHALHYDKLPDRLVTVFAGQDKEATQQARDYFEGYAPSSPSFALIKDGKITEMIERYQIEGHDVMDVINQLQGLFENIVKKDKRPKTHVKVKSL